MEIEILISTMNRKSISEMELFKRNIFSNCTIINQITVDEIEPFNEEIEGKNIRMFSFKEKGLSKSRNRALDKARGEIILLTDDDVYFYKDTFKKIKECFEKNNDCAILTFKFDKFDKKLNKKYKNTEFYHNKRTIRKVSSVEIAIKKDKIKNIRYNEKFGLGSYYNSGEENIFLKECLKNKLNIKFIPESILKHPNDSSQTLWNDQAIKSKGVIFYELFGFWSYILLPLLFLKNKERYEKSFYSILNISYKEIKHYKENNEN